MTDTTLTVTVPAELAERLSVLAERNGHDLSATLRQAMEEYADHWEDYHHTVDALDAGEDERVMLNVASE